MFACEWRVSAIDEGIFRGGCFKDVSKQFWGSYLDIFLGFFLGGRDNDMLAALMELLSVSVFLVNT
jgi:hypothetical protein